MLEIIELSNQAKRVKFQKASFLRKEISCYYFLGQLSRFVTESTADAGAPVALCSVNCTVQRQWRLTKSS
jgi:hypothetical protein